MYEMSVEHLEDPNGYAGVRGAVNADLPLGSPLYLTLADPWGHTWSAIAGDKPENGRNGFGWLVSHPGDYTLTLKQYLLHDRILILLEQHDQKHSPPTLPGSFLASRKVIRKEP